MIKVVDNFLTNEEMEEICKYLYEANWRVQCSSPQATSQFLMWEVSKINYFNTYLFNRVKKELNFKYSLQRAYFNGQWFGMDGQFHTDGCETTCLIYISGYENDWGGFTQILTSETTQEIIAPVQGRLVSFPGNWEHKAYAYSYQSCPMRISLAFKCVDS